MKHCESGITLLETMVTVSIVTILVATGVPGLVELYRDGKQGAYVMDLVSHLNFARSEAIKRGSRVSVCPSLDGAVCSGGSRWESGWVTFVDPNGNGDVDLAETILHVHGKLDDDNTLLGSRMRITYQGTGLSPGYNDTLKLCDSRGAMKARSVIISMQGRVRVAVGATSCP